MIWWYFVGIRCCHRTLLYIQPIVRVIFDVAIEMKTSYVWCTSLISLLFSAISCYITKLPGLSVHWQLLWSRFTAGRGSETLGTLSVFGPFLLCNVKGYRERCPISGIKYDGFKFQGSCNVITQTSNSLLNKQARKARGCDSYLQIYESLTHLPTH